LLIASDWRVAIAWTRRVQLVDRDGPIPDQPAANPNQQSPIANFNRQFQSPIGNRQSNRQSALGNLQSQAQAQAQAQAAPMFQPDDTIVAIATPAGRGGIGVVRISGPDAPRIASALTARSRGLEPRRATFCRVAAAGGAADQVILTFFPAPHSYTGEDVVEISAHGSPVLLRMIVEAALTHGARLAEPGEFTLRAYLRERIDLVQAEAVRDLVDAVTPLQARAAYDQLEGTLTGEIREIDRHLFDLTVRLEASLDFPEEGYHFVEFGEAAREIDDVTGRLDALLSTAARGRLIREGLQVAIAGRPNVGKSSLFNSLAGAGRAIVTETPGTTRDLLTEIIDVDGVPMTIVDTAGVRTAAADPIEIEGIARAVAVRDVAHVIVAVLDRSSLLSADDRQLLEATAQRPRVIAVNKCDLPAAWNTDTLGVQEIVCVSARSGEGLDCLRQALGRAAAGEATRDVPPITNVRHAELMRAARAALGRASAAASSGTPEEFVVADLTEARQRLEEVTGVRTSDDVLHAIFDRFCIGK
jgi:tRNA modification GTPase